MCGVDEDKDNGETQEGERGSRLAIVQCIHIDITAGRRRSAACILLLLLLCLNSNGLEASSMTTPPHFTCPLPAGPKGNTPFSVTVRNPSSAQPETPRRAHNACAHCHTPSKSLIHTVRYRPANADEKMLITPKTGSQSWHSLAQRVWSGSGEASSALRSHGTRQKPGSLRHESGCPGSGSWGKTRGRLAQLGQREEEH